jgi:hypothetical protein
MLPSDSTEVPGLACTVESPAMVTVEASRARLELGADAGALALAADLAESAAATGSLDKLLVHQMVTAHALAMKLAARAGRHSDDAVNPTLPVSLRQRHAVEAARATGAAARLMDAFQRGALTLDRLRNGGRQVVTVRRWWPGGRCRQHDDQGTPAGGGRRNQASTRCAQLARELGPSGGGAPVPGAVQAQQSSLPGACRSRPKRLPDAWEALALRSAAHGRQGFVDRVKLCHIDHL